MSSITEDWGELRVVIDGQDVTHFRGGLVFPASYQLVEPFGDGPATIGISHAVPQEAFGTGALSWLQEGNSVDIVRLHPDGTTTTVLWSGYVVTPRPSSSEEDWDWSIDCQGATFCADLQLHKPPTFRDPTDIGSIIADDLNAVVSRRYQNCTRVTTGILTNQRGASSSTTVEWVQELLGTAVTDDGDSQWTVGRTPGNARKPRIHLKDRDTVHWTVRCGQPGVSEDLSRDPTQTPNVIFGRGVSTAGYAWAGWVYPGMHPDSAPAYPNAGAGDTLSLGDNDADTDSGTGVSDYQRRINELGFDHVAVDGVLNSNDIAAVREIQRRYGLLIDGIIGPQTWAATFDVGANVGNLDVAFRMPLAWDPKVLPRLFNADGSDAGANPAYDASVLRVEVDIDYGSGISRSEATRSARAQMARDYPVGWVGTITLRADPNEGSIFDIREGENIKLQSFAGTGDTGVLLHIASVQVSPADLSVSLTVDQKARDLITIASILERNKENSANPARMKPGRVRRAKITPDHVVEFDGESAGGIVPRFALFANLWSVIRIPISQNGRIAGIDLRTSTPTSKWAMAMFGAPVTPANLLAWVGNPLTNAAPWSANVDTLEGNGWVEGWGSSNDACGYYPLAQSQGGSITGRFRDDGTLQYLSIRPPWVWLAFYAPNSCFVQGRFLPAPLDM